MKTPTGQFSSILSTARKYIASDVHIIAGLPPAFRVSGEIILATNHPPFTRDELLALTKSLLTEQQLALLEKERELCISYYHEEQGRIRLSLYHRIGVPEMALRMCNLKVETAEKLMLPSVIDQLCERLSGLVLITGPTGVGKTTTLNYMIDVINSSRRCKIITIEDPVEFEHKHRKSIVTQIEVGTDTKGFASCLRHVLRLDPDVIVIGEMRDQETIETALTAAETGHLVLATLHTPSAVGTVERIVSVFGGERQAQAQLQVANTLQGIIAQRLIPTVDKKKRVLAAEVLLTSLAVQNIIREERLHQLQNIIATSRNIGMRTMEDSLAELYLTGQITLNRAYAAANNQQEIERLLKKE